MPIYEYHCSRCGDFEVMQRISERPLRICPTCRRKVTKLISNTTFHLKGSGWYITDYARKGAADADGGAEKKSDDKPKSETKAETKSESSAAKSEPKPSKSSRSSSGKKSPKAKSAA